MSVYLNGVDITATAGALVIHDTDIKADLGDYSGQTNLQTLLAALGIPDTEGKPLYTCLVTDRLDNVTYGLSPLQVLLAAIPTTAMRGTENAALAATLEDAMQKATDPSYSQDTDSQEAIAAAVSAIPTTMVGTDGAALASAWTAALATALANYTAVRAGYIDDLKTEAAHRSYIFPDLCSNIDLTCTLTSGISDTFGTWAEITDSGATTFGSLFSATGGHISALAIRSTDTADKMYVIEVGYGPDNTHVTIFDVHEFGSGTKFIGPDAQVRFRPPAMPAGQKVWYRMKTEDTAGATATIALRYHFE